MTPYALLYARPQPRERKRVVLGVVALERGLRAEEAWQRKRKQAPQVEQAIFDRRPGENKPVLARKIARDLCNFGRGRFDELSFVEDDGVPALRGEKLRREPELGVVGEDELRTGQ